MNFSKLKPNNIPVFVTFYGGVLALIGTYLGISALITPSTAVGYIDGAEMISGAWAGRTLGMALALLLALWFRNAEVYTIAFLASACREGGDIIGAIHSGSTNLLPALCIFFVLDLVCLYLSIRALQKASAD